MPFLLLLYFTACCLSLKWPQGPSPFGVGGSLLITALLMASFVGASALIAGWTQSSLRRNPAHREALRLRYGACRVYHLFGLLAFFGIALYGGGWIWTVRTVFTLPGETQPIPGAEIPLLAPFLAALIFSWAFFYDAERAFHDLAGPFGYGTPFWTRWEYVTFHVRNNLALVLAPVSLLIIEQGILRLYPSLEEDPRFLVVAATLLLGVFIGMPWILRVILSLKPMAPGPLRDRLLAAARRLDFKCSNILVWNTRGGVANAMVVGILPYPRYVLLTDRLISDLTPEEVEAVFGHEVGHVKHYHMVYYLGFMLVSLAVVTATWAAIASWSARLLPGPAAAMLNNEELALVPLVGLLGPYIFVVFGFLSRRCERQADIYGCKAVSCRRLQCDGHNEEAKAFLNGSGLCTTGILTFIRALEKVAYLNGISRHRPGWLQSWQHSTIARRVEFLQRILLDPSLEPCFQRTVFRVKWGLFLGLIGVLVVLVLFQEWGSLLQGLRALLH